MEYIKKILAAILVNFPVAVVKLRYLMRFKRLPNLKEPHDLNEKILYQKLYADTTLWSRLADKVLVRDYVKECGLECILTKLYAVWDKATDICFDELPDAFMLKSNNGDGRGTNIAICDKKSLTVSDIEALKDKAACWSKQKNIGALSAEPHYKFIKPLVFAEELLPIPKDEKSMVDYKLWCFNGEPYVFWCFQTARVEEKLKLHVMIWNGRIVPTCLQIISIILLEKVV